MTSAPLWPNLCLSARLAERARRLIHRYRFPVQETSLRGGEDLWMPGGDRLGKLVSLDPQAGTADIDKPAVLADTHPEAVFAHDHVPTDAHKKALVRLGEYVADSRYCRGGRLRSGSGPDPARNAAAER